MLLSEYIKMLKRTLVEHGDHHVAITQDGYYAEGIFAQLYTKAELQILDERPNRYKWIEGIHTLVEEGVTCKYVVLGHSYQSY